MSLNKLNMAEISIAEKKSGLSIRRLFDFESPNSALVTAVAWVIKLREDSTLNYDDFAKSITFDECFAIINPDEDDELKK